MQVIRRGNRVKRFHTVDLLVPETVGHHSANVMAILVELHHPQTYNQQNKLRLKYQQFLNY